MPFLVRLLVLAVLLAPSRIHAQATNGNGGESLRLRPGDALRLEVRDEPALRGDYAIDGEGYALLPMVGLVQVGGRTFDEVRQHVLAAFARELANAPGRIHLQPVVRVAVLGEVNRPGLVMVDPTLALLDVIASAGGLTGSADRTAISLVRDGAPVLTTSLGELTTVRTPILPGDHIVVGRRSWVQENMPMLVGGAVSVVATLITALLLR